MVQKDSSMVFVLLGYIAGEGMIITYWGYTCVSKSLSVVGKVALAFCFF